VNLLSRFVRSTSGKVAIAVLVSTAISVPASVWAVTTFTDVPTSHPFYNEISAVAGAGIALGFGDGGYHPGADITRQAMAAFMERGVGRAAAGEGTVNVNSGEATELAAVAMDAGATGAATKGFVRVSGSVWASTTVSTFANCPCNVQASLYDGDTIVAWSYLQIPKLADGQDSIDSTSVETVLPVDGDSTHRYRIVTQGINTFGSALVSATGHMTATYFPLSGDGDSTAAYDLTCPKDDPWEQNDTSATSSDFFFSGSTSAIVCPPSAEEDWYEDFVQEDSTVNVTVNFSHAEGDIDVCLYGFDEQLVCSTGITNQEAISYPGASAGTYRIRVYLASDTGSTPGNPYILTASK
jgi:hypothetical protein